MKLILFVPQLRSGGAQQVAVLVSSGLIALGHEVYIAAATLEGELLPRVDAKCHLVDLQAKKPIRAQKQLTALVNRVAPHSVICFGIYTGIAAALASFAWNVETVLVIRNENNLATDWKQGTSFNRMIGPTLSRWASRRAHVVAVSHSLAQATAEFLRMPAPRITTILNPVIDDTKPALNTTNSPLHSWLEDTDTPTFVAMGRLEHQKGFDTLIDAFARMQVHAAARLLIFGEGSLRAQLQSQIDRANLQHLIKLAGHTDHPIAQMQAAHAFVLSSRFEGFGLVLVEALWAGSRVISTHCDYGPAEMLENGRYGTLVPVDDPAALGDAMLDSLNNQDRKPRPPEAWFEQFTATAAASQHIALIESISARGKSIAT